MVIKQVPLVNVWQIRQQVMYPNQPISFVQLENDNEGVHLGVYNKEALLSIISLFKVGQELQFRKFATRIEYQGKGIGSMLLKYVMDWAIAQHYNLVWCNARSSATSLYERFGMDPVGETWVKNNIKYIKMQKAI